MDNQQTRENVQYLEQYAKENIAQQLIVKTDLNYGDQSSQRLDIIYPEVLVDKKTPVVFLVHGGGWVAGNKESMLPYAKMIADQG